MMPQLRPRGRLVLRSPKNHWWCDQPTQPIRSPEPKMRASCQPTDGPTMTKDLIPVTTDGDDGGELPPTLREVLTETLERTERLHEERGEITGVTSGLQPGNLIVVSSRAAVGQTTLVLDFARHAAVRAGVPTLLCSLELNRNEASQRLSCADCSVDLMRLRTGQM